MCIHSYSVALLSGVRNAHNHYISQRVYHRMKKLFSQSEDSLIPAAILLADPYGSSGDVDKASDIKSQLHRSDLKKNVDLSWTVINGKVYVS